MSSHHIVREDQEPALILEDWQGLDEELLHQLLEWSPTLITSDQLVTDLIARQTKVDIVIGTADPRPLQDTIRFIYSPEPFVDTAIQYLIKQGYQAAYLVSSGVRPESLLSYVPDITVTLFSDGVRYYPVRSGFSKWKPKGETIYIGDAERLSYTGLNPISTKQFQTVDDGFFTLSFPQERVVIGERYSFHSTEHA